MQPALQQQQYQSIRNYHTTSKREIVPLILATVVVGGGYYSYRALQRMDTEWEDYQWALQQYERQQLKNTTEESPQQKAVAIDLGTVFTKLATRTATLDKPGVEVAVSREGDRAFFNGIGYDHDNGGGGDTVVTCRGRSALERFYFSKEQQQQQPPVTLPSFAILLGCAGDHGQMVEAQKVVSDVLKPALTEVLDRLDMVPAATERPVRKIIAVPSTFVGTLSLYQTAFEGVLSSHHGTTSSQASFVPEPVAAVWGAQFLDILPYERKKDASTLVIDVGGWTTQVAMVRNDKVVHSTTLSWGGESVVEQVVELLLQQRPASSPTPISDARALALVQVQARHAVAELASPSKARVHVHVPYLFANPQQHHLDAHVAVQDHVRQHVVEDLVHEELSPHLPRPTDLTSLWTSVLTQLLEQSATLPTGLDHVLLVGGGAKMPLVQSSVVAALQLLMGAQATAIFPVVDPTLRSELTVLGAATLLPSFDYSVSDGLVRRNE